jgi:hypothetical protein
MNLYKYIILLNIIFSSAASAGSPERVVAIGDLHGDFNSTKKALIIAKVINEKEEWIGGKTYLVQVGDVIDRGDDDKKNIDLFEKLKKLAKKAGGRVIPLLGNHEIMNVELDFRYVWLKSGKEFEMFYSEKDVESEKDQRIILLAEHLKGRAKAFQPGGAYAKILSKNKSIVIVGDTVFVHGGVLPKWANYGIDKINKEVSQWMKGEIAKPLAVLDTEGPFWSRHFSKDTTPENCLLLDETLKILKVKRMVVAHTVQKIGINSACDKKVWRVDTGASSFYGGEIQALEIVEGKIKILK